MKQVLDLKKLVKENENYRKVLVTGKQSQLVLMSLPPGEEIGEEIHPTVDQIFLFEEGKGEIVIDNKLLPIEEHSAAFVPAGAKHIVRCTGKKPLKLCSIYSSPVHAPELVEKSAPKSFVKT
ncbi:MAG TPA: cupin domain-containing protein [Candidatus Eisenbacteria bacterium]|nr:cupin domain-containing protein [Candidatus Eisenbacteria bacterium]